MKMMNTLAVILLLTVSSLAQLVALQETTEKGQVVNLNAPVIPTIKFPDTEVGTSSPVVLAYVTNPTDENVTLDHILPRDWGFFFCLCR